MLGIGHLFLLMGGKRGVSGFRYTVKLKRNCVVKAFVWAACLTCLIYVSKVIVLMMCTRIAAACCCVLLNSTTSLMFGYIT